VPADPRSRSDPLVARIELGPAQVMLAVKRATLTSLG